MGFAFLFSFLKLFVLATGTIEFGVEEVNHNEILKGLLDSTSRRLERAAAKRPFRYSAMNDSLELTAKAARSMRRGGDKESILARLKQAEKKYKENSYVPLLRAVVLDTQGKTQLANDTFIEYLVKSRTYTGYDKKFIKHSDFHRLRRNVYDLLAARGVSVEEESERFQTVIPFEQLMNFMIHPEKEDVVASVTLIVLTIGGGICLILAAFFGISLKGPFLSTLPVLYGLAWLTYALWIMDLAFGLPFKWSRHFIVSMYFVGAPAFFFLRGAYNLWRKKNVPLEEGYRLCPKCEEPIVVLAVQCPKCHTKFKK